MATRRACRVTLLAVVSLSACVPYAVGSTAQPTPLAERQTYVMASVITNGGEQFGDTGRGPQSSYLALDGETRFGISPVSDIGLRIPSGSGLIVNYKRLHNGFAHPDSSGFATMWGGGFINGGWHAHLESTLIWSGARRGAAIPYWGARFMQAIPLNSSAASDDPTVGVFLGLSLGNLDFAIAPELAIYYDRSVLGLRDSPWMFIPTISLRDLPLPPLFGPRFSGRR